MTKKEAPEKIILGGETYIHERCVSPKPRKFEEGKFYQVVFKQIGIRDVAEYHNNGYFYTTGDHVSYSENDFSWIGEKLDLTWSEENE